MPMRCEVCGALEAAEEAAALNADAEHLHVCANCRTDRGQPDVAAATLE